MELLWILNGDEEVSCFMLLVSRFVDQRKYILPETIQTIKQANIRIFVSGVPKGSIRFSTDTNICCNRAEKGLKVQTFIRLPRIHSYISPFEVLLINPLSRMCMCTSTI